MFDFIKNEHEILKRWKDGNVFQKMVKKNQNSKQRYTTLDGPITANASMCIHHVWGRTFKDAMIKYNTLKGHSAQFQNGFDAQGMWVEVEVEKLLGLNDKKAITNYGLGNFTEKCIERVNFFADMQTNQSIRLGQLMDWENSYFTNADHNIESIWHFLKVCHERNMLVRSHRIMQWCTRCGTSLSEHEMIGSYSECSHKAVFVKVKLNQNLFAEPSKILVWTTTPWTLSSNCAIAVNPDHKYLAVRVKSDPNLLIVGKEAIKTIKKSDIIETVKEFNGSELVGKTYQPMLPLAIQQFEHTILPWSAVSATDGTGAVHIAPGCGAEDFELGMKHGIKPIVPIDEAGKFTEEFEFLAGLSTTECEQIIFDKLFEQGSLHFIQDFKHNYPYCWRCKTNVVFKLVEGWDIATKKIKPALLRAVREDVKWHPAFLQKTMENWLESMGDWNISRRRFYGLPLPIYPCSCGKIHVVGSKAELKKLSMNPEKVDTIPHLHRPYIDEIQIKCPGCNKPISRVPDVGDCWLDAGITPFSTKGYFTDKKYWQQNFPSQVVIEMKEQIRLWFYSQLFMSVVLENKAPYKNVVGYGTILDEDGKKFSKTGPKNIKFDDAVETFGADAMRYLFSSSNPANDMRFGPNMIDETRKKMLAFFNAFMFFDTYAKIDKPNLEKFQPKNLSVIDLWLLETLNQYITSVETSYESFKLHEVVEYTEALVEDLSNFYIRLNRRRFWKNTNDADKNNAYWILHQAISAIAIVMAPITPFFSEYIWSKIKNYTNNPAEFIMLANFPKPLTNMVKKSTIIEQVRFIKQIISQAHALRASEQLKLKQPLSVLYIKTNENAIYTEALKNFNDILCDEINVKRVQTVQDETMFNAPYLSVDFKKAGAVLKGDVQKLKNTLADLSDNEMQTAIEQYTKGTVSIGQFKNLPSDMFERKLKSKPEYVSITESDLTIVLDTTLTAELISEGQLREIIRGIQLARQTADLEITSRISLCLHSENPALAKVINDNAQTICTEVLAHEPLQKALDGDTCHGFSFSVDGSDVVGTLKKV